MNDLELQPPPHCIFSAYSMCAGLLYAIEYNPMLEPASAVNGFSIVNASSY